MALIPNSQVFSSFPAINSSTNPLVFPKFIKTLKISASSTPNNSEDNKPLEQQIVETDHVKLAYKKEIKLADPSDKIALDSNTLQEKPGVPIPFFEPYSIKREAFSTVSPSVRRSFFKNRRSNKENGENGFIKKENGKSDRSALPKESVGKKEKLTISSIDFVGLGFSDNKKSRGLPAGLVPIVDPFSGGDLPDVEILVGDTSKFVDTETSKSNRMQEDDTNTYKPKVSTWGVFPRPNDISKTFGGGRTIRPGEVLESAEEKAAKQARTRELLAAYKSRVGLTIDPNLKLECEEALKDGDSFMDLGKLQEALPFYEKVMNKLPFQAALHGLAALQWSICQDSLRRYVIFLGLASGRSTDKTLRGSRAGLSSYEAYVLSARLSNEARSMYEKLQSHPNPGVSKRARQFMFSFQAMEMMKVTGSTFSSMNTDYQNYFNAFIRDKVNYSLKEDETEEGAIRQAIPYIIFLLFPIFIVLLIAVRKGV
ncbi:hypothetical protein RND71_001638 [Anisodus tanguticus]|uniref:Uncharacterized protein n=1 Tax=Anisodus tanguticus TaxID=243964 RepID=A0AAE1T311_9SOLA|nr:hypothetical protein RND71_001638 [Anisodus tanguticus]